MTIRGVESSYAYRMVQGGQKREKDSPVGGFPKGFTEQKAESETGEKVYAKGRVSSKEMYAYQKAAGGSPVRESGQMDSGIGVETEVRNVKYEDCDRVSVDVLSGYVMKVQVDAPGRSVYVEVKHEDGETCAYEFDPFHIPRGTENTMEKLALECYHRAVAESAGAEQSEEQNTEEATPEEEEDGSSGGVNLPGAEKAERYAYHPKYIGEMTNDEWDELLKKADQGIEEGKEASRLHKEEMEKKAEEKSIDRRSAMQKRLDDTRKYVPYSWLADENGIVEYNGVIFQCDYESGALCLGDMSNKEKVLTIPLSGGGCLKVNRDNIGDLSAAIGMFSPEDVNRILRALAQDAKVRKVEQELEEEADSIGEPVEEHLDEEVE